MCNYTPGFFAIHQNFPLYSIIRTGSYGPINETLKSGHQDHKCIQNRQVWLYTCNVYTWYTCQYITYYTYTCTMYNAIYILNWEFKGRDFKNWESKLGCAQRCCTIPINCLFVQYLQFYMCEREREMYLFLPVRLVWSSHRIFASFLMFPFPSFYISKT